MNLNQLMFTEVTEFADFLTDNYRPTILKLGYAKDCMNVEQTINE